MGSQRGVRVRATPVRPVTFVCPYCGVDRLGQVVELQRWYHVGRVALVPLAMLDSMVECETCHARSGIAVLNVPTASMLADILFEAMRHAVAAVVRASQDPFGGVDRAAEMRAVDVMRLAGFEYDLFALGNDVASTFDEGTSAHLHHLSGELTAHGKQSLLHRLNSIALADGPMTDVERSVLLRAGAALGMPAPHVHGVLAVAAQTTDDSASTAA